MKPTKFAVCITNFLTHYLSGQRNLSQNTVKAYRDVFIIFLRFCSNVKKFNLEKLDLKKINVDLLEEFLSYLEKEKGCSLKTLNHRLTIMHSFFRYVQIEEPDCLLQCQRILAMPLRRCINTSVNYLSKEYLAAILAQPDLKTISGRRDIVLLSMLYDTAARVQELIDLSVGDIRLDTPAQIRILGKGQKVRFIPIMESTANVLKEYLIENSLTDPETLDVPLFRNRQGNKLTRAGVNYILQKYAKKARNKNPTFKQAISPHTFRHTKGMHLLQGGVSLDIIRDFLGHVDIKTTEIYAKANLEMKRAALEKVSTAPTPKIPSWKKNRSLLEWLQSL